MYILSHGLDNRGKPVVPYSALCPDMLFNCWGIPSKNVPGWDFYSLLIGRFTPYILPTISSPLTIWFANFTPYTFFMILCTMLRDARPPIQHFPTKCFDICILPLYTTKWVNPYFLQFNYPRYKYIFYSKHFFPSNLYPLCRHFASYIQDPL